MGPQRHSADAGKPEESIKHLEADIAVDRQMYLPYDPVRRRALIAFGGGTEGREEGVQKVAEHFKDVVQYYEPRNEPNYRSNGTKFYEKEMKPFYQAVKSMDKTLKVMGPGTVAIAPNILPFIEDFLKAGGAKYIDAFSFHAYNAINGDLALGRRSMNNLMALLKKYGAEKKELWQTEQGYAACLYGVYKPRLQGRWTMLEMMLLEQYGLPREHNHSLVRPKPRILGGALLVGEQRHSLNPAVPLIELMAEEQFGTVFSRAFDFGEPGNKIYIGNLFESPDRSKAMVMFMSAGQPRRASAVEGLRRQRDPRCLGIRRRAGPAGPRWPSHPAGAGIAGIRRVGKEADDRGRADRLGPESRPGSRCDRRGRQSARPAETPRQAEGG